jgi:hypothetical protein
MASKKRTLQRNQVKKFMGNNHIQKEWKFHQIRKYGFINWFRMRLACDPGKRRYNTLSE